MAEKRTIWDFFNPQPEPHPKATQSSRRPMSSLSNNLPSPQSTTPVVLIPAKAKVHLGSGLSLPPGSHDTPSSLRSKKKTSLRKDSQNSRSTATPAQPAIQPSRRKMLLSSKRRLSLSLPPGNTESPSAHTARKKPKSIRDFMRAPQTTGSLLRAAPRATSRSSVTRTLSLETPKSSSLSLLASSTNLSTSLSPMSPPPQAATHISRTISPLSSSLSLPPSSTEISSSDEVHEPEAKQLSSSQLQTWNSSSALEIKDSDDESEDSDQSLEDLANLLTFKSSEEKHRQQSFYQGAPATPVRPSKYQKNNYGLPASPLTIQPKYKFDLSSLLSHAEKDVAAEASSKRVQSIIAGHDQEESSLVTHSGTVMPSNLVHGAILESVVAEAEDGTAHKVARAIRRTEATVEEIRWYFFETHSEAITPERKQFPKNAVQGEWGRELKTSKMRHHTFISGFAADMVILGRSLPDEVFLWLLDEICVETSEQLRSSYINVLNESFKKVKELVTPEVIQKMFQSLGGSVSATTVGEKVKPVQKLADPYPKRDWSQLLSTIKLFGQIGDELTQSSRTHLAVLILRLGIDELIFDNVDILVTMQQTLRRLCRATPDEEWESFCQEVCSLLFNGVGLASMRKQLVDSICSSIPRTHDLRRRLAMCFFFEDIAYSKDHSHSLTNLHEFLIRLTNPVFQTNSTTDWRETRALIDLLNIAIDDGRSSKVDLSDRDVEHKFNADVDDICIMIKQVMKMVGADAQPLRLAMQSAQDRVVLRLGDAVRTKPKPTEAWFDRPRERGEQTFEAERAGMDSFVRKMGRIGKDKRLK